MAARRQPLLEHVHRLASRLEPETDAVLLERFLRQRDEVAFEALVRRHGAMVLGVCRRVLGNLHDAEDVFQAVFLVLARKAASIRPSNSLPAWLHGVAHRLALKHRQAQIRRQHREARTAKAAEVPPPSDPLEQLTGREILQALDEELQRLRESYRLPLLLCWLEGLTQDEAAGVLGWTLPSVKARLQRGRALLHARLARRGLTLGAGLLVAAALGHGVAAALPPGLARATVKAALRFAAGEKVGIAAGALALAEEGMIAVRLTGMKIVVALLGLTLVVSVGGVLARQIGARRETEPRLAIEETRPSAEMPEQPERRGRTAARVDLYGDPLPPGALARLGTLRRRYGPRLYSLAFTRDGKRLLTAGGSNLPRLWDVSNNKLLREFDNIPKPQFHGENFFCASGAVLSPDERILAVRGGGPQGSLYLLETATGKRLHEFPCAKRKECGISLDFAFSPDSAAIAARLDDRLELWDVAAGRTLWQKDGKHVQDIVSLDFSPDGKLLATAGGEDGVHLWDARSGELLRELGREGQAERVVFAPHGRTLAVDHRKDKEWSVRLWDVASGKEVWRLTEPEMYFSFSAFSPDGKIVATHGYASIRLWDAATGKELRRGPNTYCFMGPAAFSPDGKLLAAPADSLVHFWEAASGRELPCPLPVGHETAINSVAFTPDGQTLISAAGDHTLRWWDATTGQQRLCLPRTDSPLWYYGFPQAVLSPDATMLAVSFLDVADGKLDGIKATRAGICLRDAATGKELGRLDNGIGMPDKFIFSPDGKWLAQGFWIDRETHFVRIWDVVSGKRCEEELSGICPLFSPDGSILALLEPGHAIHFWQTATGHKIHSILLREDIRQMVLSPDGRLLATATGDSTIALYPWSWDKQWGGHLARPLWSAPPSETVDSFYALEAAATTLFPLVFSPDGRMLASRGGNQDASTVYVWETASGKERARFRGHLSGVLTLTFSADGRRLASGSADTTTLIWDVTGRGQDGGRHAAKLSDRELEVLWADLARDDAERAGRAVWALVAAGPQAVSLLAARLRPAVADLKSPQGPPLPLEERQPCGDALRGVRAVEVLEHMGTSEARLLVEALSRGAAGVLLTREAQAALKRLNAKRAG
jgi:RNA polymerase sigma factor (sigma-70 family)